MDKGFVDIARIYEGGSFGENALRDGKPRFISVKCLERCHLLFISKAGFEKARDETDRKARNELVNFIKRIPLFESTTRTSITKLTQKLHDVTCNRGQVLFNQGDKADKVYIVRSGEFIVTKSNCKIQPKKENIEEIL